LFDYRTLSKTGFFAAALAAAFLLFAISSHWRYSFYIIMRLTVCTIAIYLAYNSFVAGRVLWGLTLGAVAALFNPVLQRGEELYKPSKAGIRAAGPEAVAHARASATIY
jgi:hypothetical protein